MGSLRQSRQVDQASSAAVHRLVVVEAFALRRAPPLLYQTRLYVRLRLRWLCGEKEHEEEEEEEERKEVVFGRGAGVCMHVSKDCFVEHFVFLSLVLFCSFVLQF